MTSAACCTCSIAASRCTVCGTAGRAGDQFTSGKYAAAATAPAATTGHAPHFQSHRTGMTLSTCAVTAACSPASTDHSANGPPLAPSSNALLSMLLSPRRASTSRAARTLVHRSRHANANPVAAPTPIGTAGSHTEGSPTPNTLHAATPASDTSPPTNMPWPPNATARDINCRRAAVRATRRACDGAETMPES
jgi:hypothetical protein